VIEPSVVTAAAAVLIARIVTVPAGLLAKGLSAKPLVVLGRLSYGIYLWHVPMTMALDGHIHNHLALAAVVMVLSSAAALVSWVMVEMPAQRLRQAMEARSVRRLAVLNRASA
jgi:peptidoglycan/LPS O-acetylase OafA/YrhL